MGNTDVLDRVNADFSGLISMIFAPLDFAIEGIIPAGITSPVVPMIIITSHREASSTDLEAASSGMPSPKNTKSGFRMV